MLAGVGPVLHYRPTEPTGRPSCRPTRPWSAGSRVLGAVRVALEAPEPLATVLGRSGWLLVALAAIDALLVVGLGFFVLTRLVVRPLQAMQMATARVGGRRLGAADRAIGARARWRRWPAPSIR